MVSLTKNKISAYRLNIKEKKRKSKELTNQRTYLVGNP
jgi:hypothetical protein